MRTVTSLGLVMALSAFATVRGQEEPTLEVTVYSAECRALVVDATCPEGQARPLVPATYTLYPQSQRLKVTWARSDSSPLRVDRCVVADVDNWSCIYHDNSGAIGMLQGRYWNIARPPENPKGYRVEVFRPHSIMAGRIVYVSKEQHERLEAEFGPRQSSID